MANAVDRPIGRGAYALDVFDALPPVLRDCLRTAAFNFDPVQAQQLVAAQGEWATLNMIRQTETQIIRSTAPLEVALVSVLR